ncbi:hypothetical protein CEXT_105191 [Caerostris extrusa]|uniref:Uncharacterized protein n=1 Tax=Caerostris extrusa TaxID=172846 RepID=A0AAV4TBL1_CAEEX|nr:hypothetical protein CEXT_105191 [Caerostris extrusa]
MPPKSLYDICHRRTFELMTEDEHWMNAQRFLSLSSHAPDNVENPHRYLGQSDSSWAVNHIRNNSNRDARPQYGLRKCYWGFSIAVEDNPEQIAAYNLMFPEVIRSSILIFSLVVELHIVVRHENCLEHLKILNASEA